MITEKLILDSDIVRYERDKFIKKFKKLKNTQKNKRKKLFKHTNFPTSKIKRAIKEYYFISLLF